MKKKTKKNLFFTYLALLAISLILAIVFWEIDVLTWIFLCLFYGGGIIFIATVLIARRKNAKLMLSFIQSKDYATGKVIFEEKLNNYLAYGSKIIASYYIVIFSFALNDIERARELLSKTIWKSMESMVKYFEILLNLKDQDLDLARSNFSFLAKKPTKNAANQLTTIKRIFACIDSNNFEDKFYLDSIFPIVKEIYDCYSTNKA